MKIEILFPEICNLYGDSANAMYLKKSLKKAKFIETHINDKPNFIDKKNKIDMVYLGSMTEEHQKLVIEKLLPFKEKIEEYIENDKILLATGNAFEVFGKYIESKDGKVDCLDIFNFYTKLDIDHRHNSLFIGEYKNIKIVGFKSQFSHSYLENDNEAYDFIKVNRGVGLNPNYNFEGINKNNFYGTYLLGPILPMNPFFTKYLFKLLNTEEEPVFMEEAMNAYEYRVRELQNEKTIVTSMHN